MASRGRLAYRHLSQSSGKAVALRPLSYSALRSVPEAVTSESASPSSSTSSTLPPIRTDVNVPSGAPAPQPGALTIANRKNGRGSSKERGKAGEGSKSTDKLTLVEKGNMLYQWSWFTGKYEPERRRLFESWRTGKTQEAPVWLSEEYEQARTYRSARARLWVPDEARQHPEGIDAWLQSLLDEQELSRASTGGLKGRQKLLEELSTERQKLKGQVDEQVRRLEEVQQAIIGAQKTWREQGDQTALNRAEQLGAEAEELKRSTELLWLNIDEVDKRTAETQARREGEREANTQYWLSKDRQERLDLALLPLWRSLTDRQRKAGIVRARFECARQLGWRKGYSAGYPTRNEGRRARIAALVFELSENGPLHKKHQEALSKLEAEQEEDAWEAWQSTSSATRSAEEKSAWELRDRSRIYIDDSPQSMILGTPGSRWYSRPERVGKLTFLPNDIVRLVRNNTPRGEKSYDAWKATFRVPLSMHKHALRSYLLSIYGLRTTWARSSIYRAPISRTRGLFQKTAKGGSIQTYKKVEVGLLEPFVFPEVSAQYKRERLMEEDIKLERSRVFFKATGKLRWRGKRQPLPIKDDPTMASVGESTVSVRKGVDGWTTTIPKRKSKEGSERPPILARSGIPAKRQSTILKLLSEKRRQREALINAEASMLHQRDLEVAAQQEKP
ncbi:hypothetical protein FA10DRAFT_264237 [Acaromyces ingoldii]|uniref:Large ribosomal subunit protein uL23m n=1 Tax=Acaromyces ingoldii TaxID=215250 RepID=A0A316Z0I0_9BASI|nr:hypothetical protein FA10DRAFT_264237 [Acaromyces ingoldii]PWN93605.1 hypothetical protein FA10DRAFT_264237 [Acaromyces ingoldii]